MDNSISAARRFPVVCADMIFVSHTGPGHTLRSRLPYAKSSIHAGFRISKTQRVIVLLWFLEENEQKKTLTCTISVRNGACRLN